MRTHGRESGGFGRFRGSASPARDYCVTVVVEQFKAGGHGEVPGVSDVVSEYLSGLVQSIRDDPRQQARIAVTFAEVMLLWGLLAISYSQFYRENLYDFAMYCGGVGLMALAVVAVPALAELRDSESGKGTEVSNE